jgi:MOSC domain-containing protein YiiM
MQLVSANIAHEQPIQIGNDNEITGIFKTPARGPVRIGPLGLEHDAVVSTKHHGGPDQAVYVYGGADYAWWATELGDEFAPGTFGENLTISDLESAPLRIGDRLRIGNEVVLEVTAPRIPCATLAARMGDPKFVKRFRAAARPGAYCRVIVPGVVRAGDVVALEPYSGATLTVGQMFAEYYDKSLNAEALRRTLAAPIAIRARHDYEQRLAALGDV